MLVCPQYYYGCKLGRAASIQINPSQWSRQIGITKRRCRNASLCRLMLQLFWTRSGRLDSMLVSCTHSARVNTTSCKESRVYMCPEAEIFKSSARAICPETIKRRHLEQQGACSGYTDYQVRGPAVCAASNHTASPAAAHPLTRKLHALLIRLT